MRNRSIGSETNIPTVARIALDQYAIGLTVYQGRTDRLGTMNSPRAIEIKFAAAAEAFTQLEQSFPPKTSRVRRPAKLVSVYFDTDKLDLHKHGLSLCVRSDGHQHLQTIASENGQASGTRGEWECELQSDMPDLKAIENTPAEKVLRNKKLLRSIRPIFETRVTRATYHIKIGDSLIQVAFDQGEIDTGRESTPLSEVELLLKRGQPGDLFRLAKTIAKKAPVELAFISKAERGYRFLVGDGLTAVKGATVALHPDITTRQAFQVIGRACLRQLADNLPALRKGDPEALHQARVALRRLRAAMTLFAEIIRASATEAIKAELMWITGEFAPAREMDVLWARADATTKEAQALVTEAELDGLPALDDELAQRRQRAFRRARAAVESERFRVLLIDLAAWIETGEWLSADDPLQRAESELQIDQFASAELDRRWKSVLKRGQKLRSLDPGRGHKLRIAIKIIRYASEFFVGVFPGGKAKRRRKVFLDTLEPAQDCLGELNDITVHQHFTANLAAERQHEPAGEESMAFAAGLLSGHEQARLADVMTTAEQALRRCARVKPYW
jgi:inorganic triphosphatase YgiF